MILQDWQILSLLTSFATAVYIHVNHTQKICGLTLVLLRGLFMVVLLGSIALFLPLPQQDWFFYFCALAIGFCVVWGDKHLLNAAAKHGGRLTSLFISMKIFLLFTVWSIIEPSSFLSLLTQPWVMVGMLACYIAMVAAMLGLRRQDHTAAAVVAVVPAAVFLSGADIFTKLGLDETAGFADMVYFLLVGQAGCVVGSAVLLRKDLCTRYRHVFSKKHLKGTAIILVPFLALVVTFVSAVSRAPNPAYVGAITVLTTVWLTVYYKLTRGDSANWQSTFVLVAAAMGLTLLTS
ncbi:MAG: hypothetical protein OXR68_04615 [Alphaproteobacteria bacterium]|nr:hypothetical protein [Alphaproteobacteria bacterium]MDD9919891.1 hypothetical protein [Alphaproteobacteria bacterium]